MGGTDGARPNRRPRGSPVASPPFPDFPLKPRRETAPYEHRDNAVPRTTFFIGARQSEGRPPAHPGVDLTPTRPPPPRRGSEEAALLCLGLSQTRAVRDRATRPEAARAAPAASLAPRGPWGLRDPWRLPAGRVGAGESEPAPAWPHRGTTAHPRWQLSPPPRTEGREKRIKL